jgi:hypothetical protein
MGRARVSTLAQRNGSVALTVESAGTNGTIADQPRLIGLEKVGDLAACFLRIVHDCVGGLFRRVLCFSSSIFGRMLLNR